MVGFQDQPKLAFDSANYHILKKWLKNWNKLFFGQLKVVTFTLLFYFLVTCATLCLFLQDCSSPIFKKEYVRGS